MDPKQIDLFAAPAGPDGFVLRDDFIEPAEERALLEQIAGLTLAPARYKAYTARRLVASFGGEFDYDTNRLRPGPPLPTFLDPLRARAATWLGVPPETLVHALIAQYPPGTPLGWHRDVPDFERVFGVSLGGWARMRLRRHPGDGPAPRRAEVLDVELAPRSAYLLQGDARWQWQHAIAPTVQMRWSITLRTRRVPGS